MRCALAMLVALGLSGACAREGPGAEPLRVFAAASLRDAALEFAEDYAEPIEFHFAGSNLLARQLEAGAPADLFLSAGAPEIEGLERGGHTLAGTRVDLWSNSLVVIQPEPLPPDVPRLESAADLAGASLERLALADPRAVPAGRYAHAWLEAAGLWSQLEARVVPAIDVRAALGLVSAGAVGAGVVYRTDAAGEDRVRVAFDVAGSAAPRIVYPAAVLRAARDPRRARALLSALAGPRAQALFARHGFVTEGAEPGARPSASLPPGPDSTWRPVLAALAVSLRVAAAATLLAAPLALALGWWLARREFRGKSVVETLVALPLVLPPTAVGYLLLQLFARSGLLGRDTLGFDPDVLLSFRGAVLAAACMSLPLSVRTARAAFEGVPPRLESMARSLGWSRPRVFLGLTLPLARAGLAAALVLGFGRALGEFGATVVVAGNLPGRTQTLALSIFEDIQLGRDDRALLAIGLSALLAFVLVFSVERLQRRRA